MSEKQNATRRNKTIAARPGESIPRINCIGRSIKPEQLIAFFQEYLKCHNARQAARNVGLSEKWAKDKSYQHIQRNEAYLAYLGSLVAKENAKQIAIELEPVLQEIARIAFANEHDYLEAVTVKKDGKDVTVMRRKPLEKLTREQMSAIKVYTRPDGTLDYVLRNKEARLMDLGKHLGAFNEKLILEHRHAHMHAVLDLTNVKQKDLDLLEENLARMLVPAAHLPQKAD